MEILRKIDLFQKEINALRPMEGEMLGQIQGYYRVGLTWKFAREKPKCYN